MQCVRTRNASSEFMRPSYQRVILLPQIEESIMAWSSTCPFVKKNHTILRKIVVCSLSISNNIHNVAMHVLLYNTSVRTDSL